MPTYPPPREFSRLAFAHAGMPVLNGIAMKRTSSALCAVFVLSIAVAGGIYAGHTEEAAAALNGFGKQEGAAECSVCTVFVDPGGDGVNLSACDVWENDGGSDCVDIGNECVAIGTCQGSTGFFHFFTTIQ